MQRIFAYFLILFGMSYSLLGQSLVDVTALDAKNVQDLSLSKYLGSNESKHYILGFRGQMSFIPHKDDISVVVLAVDPVRKWIKEYEIGDSKTIMLPVSQGFIIDDRIIVRDNAGFGGYREIKDKGEVFSFDIGDLAGGGDIKRLQVPHHSKMRYSENGSAFAFVQYKWQKKQHVVDMQVFDKDLASLGNINVQIPAVDKQVQHRPDYFVDSLGNTYIGHFEASPSSKDIFNYRLRRFRKGKEVASYLVEISSKWVPNVRLRILPDASLGVMAYYSQKKYYVDPVAKGNLGFAFYRFDLESGKKLSAFREDFPEELLKADVPSVMGELRGFSTTHFLPKWGGTLCVAEQNWSVPSSSGPSYFRAGFHFTFFDADGKLQWQKLYARRAVFPTPSKHSYSVFQENDRVSLIYDELPSNMEREMSKKGNTVNFVRGNRDPKTILARVSIDRNGKMGRGEFTKYEPGQVSLAERFSHQVDKNTMIGLLLDDKSTAFGLALLKIE